MLGRWILALVFAAASTAASAQARGRNSLRAARYLARVEAMLEQRAKALPRPAHTPGGKVAICFHIDTGGRLVLKEFCVKSGHPDLDALAMRTLETAAPFPPPPVDVDRGLIWVETFDEDGAKSTTHMP